MNEGEALKSNETGKIDILSFLNDVLNRLRSFWWVILILTLGLGAFNYFRSTTRYTPTYTAEATVAVAILHGGTYSNENTAQQMSKVFPYILTSGVLSDIIADDLGMSYVPGRISAKNIEGTNLLTISVTGSDPDKVYKVLQSVLRKYPEVARFVIGQTEITVIDDSGVPEDTGKTTVIRGSLVKGLLIGFAIGVVLLLLYTLLTRTVRSEKDLTNMLNVNYLGGLPIVRQKKKDNPDGEINILVGGNKDNYTESMRLIRTRLEKEMEKDDVLMVTSSIPGEGKSTVAANLAISFAEKGRNVILVDCDLRNPTTKKIFGLTESYPGLAGILRGECKVEETLAPIEVEGQNLKLQLLPGSDDISNTMEMMAPVRHAGRRHDAHAACRRRRLRGALGLREEARHLQRPSRAPGQRHPDLRLHPERRRRKFRRLRQVRVLRKVRILREQQGRTLLRRKREKGEVRGVSVSALPRFSAMFLG